MQADKTRMEQIAIIIEQTGMQYVQAKKHLMSRDLALEQLRIQREARIRECLIDYVASKKP